MSNYDDLDISTLLNVYVFGRTRNHGKKFPKLSQTSFSGIPY